MYCRSFFIRLVVNSFVTPRLSPLLLARSLALSLPLSAVFLYWNSSAADQATLQERKRDSIKAAEKHKVKEELKQEAKATKLSKHGRDGAGADRDNGSKEGGEAEDKAEAAKRSRWVICLVEVREHRSLPHLFSVFLVFSPPPNSQAGSRRTAQQDECCLGLKKNVKTGLTRRLG